MRLLADASMIYNQRTNPKCTKHVQNVDLQKYVLDLWERAARSTVIYKMKPQIVNQQTAVKYPWLLVLFWDR